MQLLTEITTKLNMMQYKLKCIQIYLIITNRRKADAERGKKKRVEETYPSANNRGLIRVMGLLGGFFFFYFPKVQ